MANRLRADAGGFVFCPSGRKSRSQIRMFCL
jgi:hypothetical protein